MKINRVLALSTFLLLIGTSIFAKPYGEADVSGNRFELKSANDKFTLGFKGYLQQNNNFSYSVPTKSSTMLMEIKRARFSIYGNAFTKSISYLFQTGFEGEPRSQLLNRTASKAPGWDLLKDYYVNIAMDKKDIQVRIGKFKAPFSRQQLISASQMQFYDHHIVTEEFQLTNTGRDVGIMVHNGINRRIEWAVAALSHGLSGRVGINHNSIDGYETTDFSKRDLRIAGAINGFIATDYGSHFFNDARIGADFIAKMQGFSTNGAVYLKRKAHDDDSEVSVGAGLDFGYLVNDHLEPVIRTAWLNDHMGNNLELLAGLNYYEIAHNLKAQIYSGIGVKGNRFDKFTAGLQFQFAI